MPDFPKAGILFYDVTTLLRIRRGFISRLTCSPLRIAIGRSAWSWHREPRLHPRSGGRRSVGAGFVPVRKVGKLPSEKIRATYDLEYGTDSLEMHRDAIAPGQNVLVVDDLLATGGTARATVDLVKQLGGNVRGAAFLIELVALNGRARLTGEEVMAVLQY